MGSIFINPISGTSAEEMDAALKAGADPNKEELWRAVIAGAGQKVDVLLKHGADATWRYEDGNTLLHLAVNFYQYRNEEKYFAVVTSLLAHGADVNAVNARGETALQNSPCLPMAKVLREAGASTLAGDPSLWRHSWKVELCEFIKKAHQEDLAAQSKKDLLAGLEPLAKRWKPSDCHETEEICRQDEQPAQVKRRKM